MVFLSVFTWWIRDLIKQSSFIFFSPRVILFSQRHRVNKLLNKYRKIHTRGKQRNWPQTRINRMLSWPPSYIILQESDANLHFRISLSQQTNFPDWNTLHKITPETFCGIHTWFANTVKDTYFILTIKKKWLQACKYNIQIKD